MKKSRMSIVLTTFFIVSVSVLLVSRPGENRVDFPVFKGPYMGQKPPGLTPEIFLPGVLNSAEMGAFCTVFSPDGAEFYFAGYQRSNDRSDLYRMRIFNGRWSRPEKLPFNSDSYENDVTMSPDGNTLVFRSWRALPCGKKPKDHSYLWFVIRTPDGWSHAKPLLCGGEPVRTGYPSFAADGTLYFVHRRDNRLGIYRSRMVNRQYAAPEFVYEVFSQDFIIGDLFVAPDESYMIISARPPAGENEISRLDLYVIFRDAEKNWSAPLKMADKINTRQGSENCPVVSPDGKYFFFNRYDPDRKRGNMYWVDARVVRSLKPVSD